MVDHQVPKSEQISIKSGGVNNSIQNINSGSNGNMNSISPVNHSIIASNGDKHLSSHVILTPRSPTTASINKSDGRIQTTVGDKLL